MRSPLRNFDGLSLCTQAFFFPPPGKVPIQTSSACLNGASQQGSGMGRRLKQEGGTQRGVQVQAKLGL